MKQEQFEKIIEAQLEMIRNVLLTKQKEYATEDRLHNFRVVGGLRDCTMEQALGGMLSKHTVSIYDMIESGKEYEPEQWNEKINDHIVYLLLLKAITEEKRMDDINEMETNPEKLYQAAVDAMQEFSNKPISLVDRLNKASASVFKLFEPRHSYTDQRVKSLTEKCNNSFGLSAKLSEKFDQMVPTKVEQLTPEEYQEFLLNNGFVERKKSIPRLSNHNPNSPHLTSDELLLALEIKEILNKRGWTGGYTNPEKGVVDMTDNESTLPSMFKNER